MSHSHVLAFMLSLQKDPPQRVPVLKSEELPEQPEKLFKEIQRQNYVCCLYDNEAWIGVVEDTSDEHGDYFIRFMYPHGPSKLFHWPNKDDTCWIGKSDILCLIYAPSLVSS